MNLTLTELAQKVYNARSLPGELAELHITLASMYSTESEKMMEVQLKKADYWQRKDFIFNDGFTEEDLVLHGKTYMERREKPLSDKQVEMMWLQTEEGKKEIKLKYTIRSLEQLIGSVKSALINASNEIKNLS